MSIKIMSKVWTEQDTCGNERLVLMALADNANDEGICWPSHTTIASKCRIDRRHVIRLVQSLVDRGYICRQRRLAKDGRKTSNIYQLLPGNFNILGPLASDSRVTSDGFASDSGVTSDVTQPGHIPSDIPATILVTHESHKPSLEPSFLTIKDPSFGLLEKVSDQSIYERVGKTTPDKAWNMALEQLRQEMSKSTFDNWVANTQAKSFDATQDILIVSAPTSLAQEWLEGRLSSTVTRLLTGILNRSVKVKFEKYQGAE
jgi:hypothetical protein